MPLRFTHWQIYYEPADVAATLTAVAASRTPRTPGSVPTAVAS
jgi:hypothetical protein